MKLTIITKVEIDLEDLPEDVRFISVDPDGGIYCFLERPYYDIKKGWMPQGKVWEDMFYADNPLDKTWDALIEVEELRSGVVGAGIELEGVVVRWEEL